MPRDTYYLPSRKLVSQDDAAIVEAPRVPRSKFIGSWNRLTTFDAGYLVPFLVEEVLPGDHLSYNVTAYIRMATALFPIMSNQRIDTHFFFVPNRIIWDNWVKMMGEQVNPSDSIAYTIPQMVSPAGGYTPFTIFDHMGLPCIGQITAGQTITHSTLPFRAYDLIWNTWFRDQNVMNSVNATAAYRGDGPDVYTNFALWQRAKSHDYFTSALPWAQKFTPLQTLFTGTAPVIGIGAVNASAMSAAPLNNMIEAGTGAMLNYTAAITNADAGAKIGIRFDTNAIVSGSNRPQIYADLAQATGVTINALRNAWLVQDLLERDARGGTRYIELIRQHFGVISPDFRVQRPEYIGGGSTPLNVTPVAQTATGGGGLGALGGVGSAAGQHRASYAATEHGIILGLISIKTELAYQQGIHRFWHKLARTDFYFPALAGLGEQAILRQEIYATGTDAEDQTVFGYQERWHEYRTRYSEVTGAFRSTSGTNIDEWHLAQQFSPAPTLSQAFLVENPPMSRVLSAGASAANQQYLADINIQRVAVRPVPMFGTPASLMRF